MPEVPLHNFFAKAKAGPYRFTRYVGKPKMLEADCKQMYDAWVVEMSAKAKGGEGSNTLASDLVQDLHEDKRQKKQESAMNARKKALDAIRNKKDSLAVNLKSPKKPA